MAQDLVGGLNFDFYLTDTATGSNFIMQPTATGEGISTIASGTFGISDDNRIVTYETTVNEPAFTVMEAGVYNFHAHLQVTSGGKATGIYWTLLKREQGGAETLLITSNEKAIDTSDAEYDIHGQILSDVTLATTDRLVLSVYANVTGGGANVEITISQEGTTVSRLSVPTLTSSLTDLFVPRDGSKTLTDNWAVGGFDMTGIGLLTATNASTSNNLEVSATASISNLTLATDLAVIHGGTGASTLNDLITLTTHTTGNYLASISDAGNNTIAVLNAVGEGATPILDAIDLNCTDCLNATEIENIYLLLAGGTLTGDLFGTNASLSVNLSVAGTASISSYQLPGDSSAVLGDCDNGTDDKLLWDASDGRFVCGSDQAGAGAFTWLGLDAGVTGVTQVKITSISFDPAHFDFSNTASAGTIEIDWGAGGPASLSQAETITGNWVNTDNPWDFSSETNATATTGILFSGDAIGFDCSEVQGIGITCNSETIEADWGVVASLSTAETITGNWVNTDNPWADNEVSDNLTIDTGSTLNDLSIGSGKTWTTTGQLTIGDGGDRIDFSTGTWDVVNGVFSGLAGLTSTGAIDFSGATFEFPNGANPTVTLEGQGAINTSASESFEFFANGNTRVVSSCTRRPGWNLSGTDITENDIWKIMLADEPMRLKYVLVEASGSNSIDWNLLINDTVVFAANKKASGSSLVKYESFTVASISDGDSLKIRVSSASADLDEVLINTCIEQDTTP